MNEDCLNSPAEWTSLSTARWDRTSDLWASAPPVTDGKKVVLQEIRLATEVQDPLGLSAVIYQREQSPSRPWIKAPLLSGFQLE